MEIRTLWLSQYLLRTRSIESQRRRSRPNAASSVSDVSPSVHISRYQYRALTRSGELKEGIQASTSQEALLQHLRALGWWPISTAEVIGQPSLGIFRQNGGQLGKRDLASFFHELSVLMDSALTIEEALALLSHRQASTKIAEASGRLLQRVRAGTSLSQAVSAEGTISPVAKGLIRAGETSGNLSGELVRISGMMAKSEKMKTEVLSALIYPAILLVTASLVIGIIVAAVVPEFLPLFDDAGRKPPMTFQLLIGLSNTLNSWGWVALCIGLAGMMAVGRLRSSKIFRLTWDRGMLVIPVFGDLFREIETARFCRTLGTLIIAGIPLPVGLTLAVDTLVNTAIAEYLRPIGRDLREGGRLVERLMRSGQFLPGVTDLLRVGEETGRLGEMLLRQAEISESNAATKVSRILSIIAPVTTLILGLVVGGIVTSLLTAILSINDLASQ